MGRGTWNHLSRAPLRLPELAGFRLAQARDAVGGSFRNANRIEVSGPTITLEVVLDCVRAVLGGHRLADDAFQDA